MYRKIFISFAILFFIANNKSNAQENYFELIQTGLVVKQDKEAKYIIVEIKDKGQAELFKSFLTSINTLFVSGKDVVSKVDNESISIHGISPAIIKGYRNLNFSIDFNLIFFFKDGRVKVDIPHINKIYWYNNNPSVMGDWLMEYSGKQKFLQDSPEYIYTLDGKLKYPVAKQQIEDFFNGFISKIIKNSANAKDW